MGKHNRETRRYLRAIKGWLPCAGKMKRQMLGEIEANIDDFVGENPEVSYEDIVSRFGTPQQIASTYVDEAETGELLRMLRVRRKILTIIASVAVLITVLWAAGVAAELYSDVFKSKTAYIEVAIIEERGE